MQQEYRFDYNDSKEWLSYLEEHGFVVVAGAVEKKICERLICDMKKCLQEFSPALEDDKNDVSVNASWIPSKNYPMMLHGGMVQYMGHAGFQWEARELTAPLFAKIWDCRATDLATSFDGFCFMNGNRKYKPREILDTIHTDQSPLKDFRWSVQGLLNLHDNGEEDGGFVAIPKSHKAHKAFLTKIGQGQLKKNWYKFSDDDKKDTLFANCVKVCAEAGDMILWDSRTFHGNTIPTSKNIRACVYVCQIPKKEVDIKIRVKRNKAWTDKRCTGHHPGDGFSMFQAVPRHGDQSIKTIAPSISVGIDDLTDLQKSLLCI